ncbi:uncharacterized protein LOC120127092 [Hibiscus syriacus]|uniref:uncharacterized protein LOC120127092 n=1 Tax=Hibiscus syriacus TaxID=106335 RepID=UPI0019243470|nr:uncharacterized protein LOC120127092 [Hibiscus syriacus]
MLNAAWCVVTEQEQVSVVLVGLSMEFESIIAIASRDTLSLDALTEMFLDCEARHKMFLSDGLSANMVVHSNDTRADDVPVKVSTDEEITEKQSSQARGQQGNSYRGRGRGRFNGSNRPQCQLCVPAEKKGEGRSRVDRESDNQQLMQLEEKDVVSSVATVLSDLCGPGEWMPMEKLHAELVEQFSNVCITAELEDILHRRTVLVPNPRGNHGMVCLCY